MLGGSGAVEAVVDWDTSPTVNVAGTADLTPCSGVGGELWVTGTDPVVAVLVVIAAGGKTFALVTAEAVVPSGAVTTT